MKIFHHEQISHKNIQRRIFPKLWYLAIRKTFVIRISVIKVVGDPCKLGIYLFPIVDILPTTFQLSTLHANAV